MAVIEVNEKNIKDHTKKCVVLQAHRHNGSVVNVNDVIIKEGEFLYDAIKRKLVRLYDPSIDDPLPNPEPNLELEPKPELEPELAHKRKSKFKPKK